MVFLEFTAAPSSVDARTSEIPTGVVTTSPSPTRTADVEFVPESNDQASTGTGRVDRDTGMRAMSMLVWLRYPFVLLLLAAVAALVYAAVMTRDA